MRAQTRAARAICYATAVAIDRAHRLKGDDAKAAHERASLLTPVAKAFSTDTGVEVASIALQVHGGMGFIEETGAAQSYRDARIAPIYEGTNGIQAIDLVTRKLALDDGAGFSALLAEMGLTAEALEAHQDARLSSLGVRLSSAVEAVGAAADWLGARRNSAHGLAGATPFLKLMGDVVGGWLLAKGALSCAERACDDAYLAARIAVAGHYADTLLAQAPGKVASVTAGAHPLEALDLAALS